MGNKSKIKILKHHRQVDNKKQRLIDKHLARLAHITQLRQRYVAENNLIFVLALAWFAVTVIAVKIAAPFIIKSMYFTP